MDILDAAAGLEQMAAATSLSLLLEAGRLVFGQASIPATTAERREVMRALCPGQSDLLIRLDRSFCSDPDDLDARLDAFARRNGLALQEAIASVDAYQIRSSGT